MKTDYKPFEAALFESLGLSHLLDKPPEIAYREAIQAAFLSGNTTDRRIATLRAVSRAFLLDRMDRMSSEFGDLFDGLETKTHEPVKVKTLAEVEQDVFSMFA